MKYHRLNEIITMLYSAWQKEPNLNLLRFLQNLADKAQFEGSLNELTDEILIYQLKMEEIGKNVEIPGLKKDYQDDFKTAILKARGVIK